MTVAEYIKLLRETQEKFMRDTAERWSSIHGAMHEPEISEEYKTGPSFDGRGLLDYSAAVTSNPGMDIVDVEKWVTPLKVYYKILTRDLMFSWGSRRFSEEFDIKQEWTVDQGYLVTEQEYARFQAHMKRNGVTVRLIKTVSCPRFQDETWRNTNGIRKV